MSNFVDGHKLNKKLEEWILIPQSIQEEQWFRVNVTR